MFNEETKKIVLGIGGIGTSFAITPMAAKYLGLEDEFKHYYQAYKGAEFDVALFDSSNTTQQLEHAVRYWEDRDGSIADAIMKLDSFDMLDSLNLDIKLRIAEIPADMIDWVVETDENGDEYVTRRTEKYTPPSSDYEFLVNRKIDRMFEKVNPSMTPTTIDFNGIHAVVGNTHSICAYPTEQRKGFNVSFLEYVCFYDTKTDTCTNRWNNVKHHVHIHQNAMVSISKLFTEMNRYVEERGGYGNW